MDRKTVEDLRAMLCEEIEAISKKGTLGTHETLDILKDLIETEKNLGKIEHYDREKEESTALAMPGYSQRKYFIDADYQPGHMSYAGPTNSYGYGGRTVYDVDRNSYMYMEPRYRYDDRRYSRTGSKSEMIKELKEMMEETSDGDIKAVIQEALTKLNK